MRPAYIIPEYRDLSALRQVRKIQERNREKIKKLNVFLAKERQEKRSEAGAALEKLYKESGPSFDAKKVLAICEKYWPDAATKKPTT